MTDRFSESFKQGAISGIRKFRYLGAVMIIWSLIGFFKLAPKIVMEMTMILQALLFFLGLPLSFVLRVHELHLYTKVFGIDNVYILVLIATIVACLNFALLGGLSRAYRDLFKNKHKKGTNR